MMMMHMGTNEADLAEKRHKSAEIVFVFVCEWFTGIFRRVRLWNAAILMVGTRPDVYTPIKQFLPNLSNCFDSIARPTRAWERICRQSVQLPSLYDEPYSLKLYAKLNHSIVKICCLFAGLFQQFNYSYINKIPSIFAGNFIMNCSTTVNFIKHDCTSSYLQFNLFDFRANNPPRPTNGSIKWNVILECFQM